MELHDTENEYAGLKNAEGVVQASYAMMVEGSNVEYQDYQDHSWQ